MAVTASPTAYRGYYRRESKEPDMFLCAVEPDTPGGEFMRRFWHPVAYERELGKVPLRVRALGEDLVVFRNLEGEVACLHLHCAHRNTSLEFGLITVPLGAGRRRCGAGGHAAQQAALRPSDRRVGRSSGYDLTISRSANGIRYACVVG